MTSSLPCDCREAGTLASRVATAWLDGVAGPRHGRSHRCRAPGRLAHDLDHTLHGTLGTFGHGAGDLLGLFGHSLDGRLGDLRRSFCGGTGSLLGPARGFLTLLLGFLLLLHL